MVNDEGTGNAFWDAWVGVVKAASAPLSSFAQAAAAYGATGETATGEASAASNAADLIAAMYGDGRAIARMTQRTLNAMQTLSQPGGADGQAATSVERSFAAFAERCKTSPAMVALDWWSASSAASDRIIAPWTDLMQRSMGIAATLGGPAGAGDPMGDALERSFGVLNNVAGINTELPALMREGATLAVGLTAAREAYRAVMAGAWQRAYVEIAREIVQQAADGKPIATATSFLALSNRIADRVFVETFNSEPYVDAQQRLSAALADQHRYEIKVVDVWARFGHFPTRRDLDVVTRELNALKREVRALRRQARTARNERVPSDHVEPSLNGK